MRLSIFGCMDYRKTIDYYCYDDDSLRDFIIPKFSISMAHMHNKLIIARVEYNTSSALSEMYLTKGISKFNKIKNEGYMCDE